MIRKIYILYDSRCGVCSRVRSWMGEQRTWFAVEFVAAGSDRAHRLFPELEHEDEPSELIVITNEGAVYFDDAAWIVCLYALVEYRSWSYRLARGPLRPLARRAWQLLSKNRRQLSAALALRSDADFAAELEAETVEGCEIERPMPS